MSATHGPHVAPCVAVTGAGGFIGRHVLAELGRRGLQATVIMRPGSVAPPQVQGHRVVQADFTKADAETAADTLAAAGHPDVLIHLAWGGLPNYLSLHHFEQEAPLHYHWLKGLVGAGLKQVLVTGTCFEYGNQSGALDETMTAQPTNPYGFAKDQLRRELTYLQAAQGFGMSWARLFYMHGEGQSANSLWPLLQAAALRGDAEFPMSGGEQLRDYLPVAEVARCLVGLALGAVQAQGNNGTGTASGHGIVNICSGKPVSVRSLVEGWIADNSWSIRPKLGCYPYPNYEPMAFWGDASKLSRCLGDGMETR